MIYAIVALALAVLMTAFTVVLFLRAPAKTMQMGKWIRLFYNLLILCCFIGLALTSLFFMIRGVDGSAAGGLYLGLGGLTLAFLLLDKGTGHLGSWRTSSGFNDFPNRVRELQRETKRLWRELLS